MRRKGYRVLAWNLDERVGEIDLLALDPDQTTLVVVEVRSTAQGELSRPAASVNHAKQKKLIRSTLKFLQERRLLGTAVRFDVILIAWPDGQTSPVIEHVVHAFESFDRFQMYS